MFRFILISLLLLSSSFLSAADRPEDGLQSKKMIALSKKQKDIEAQRTSAPSHIYASPETSPKAKLPSDSPKNNWLVPVSIGLTGLVFIVLLWLRLRKNKSDKTEENVAISTTEKEVAEEATKTEAKLHEVEEVEAIAPEETFSVLDQQFLARALSIVEKNIGNADFNASDFTQEMGMSKTHLYRKLDQLTQESPGRYIRRMRLSKAHELLLSKSGNVTEIAYEVGFNNLSYFAKCFRKQYGIAPSRL